VKINWLLCCLMLVGCGDQASAGVEQNEGSGSGRAGHAASPATPHSAGGPAAASLNADMESHFPLERYRDFPANARALLQMADFEKGRCRGGPGNNPEIYRACNSGWEAMVALERLGWCWGSENPAPVAVEDHWLRCSRASGYRPGQLGAHPPYSERDINELTNRTEN